MRNYNSQDDKQGVIEGMDSIPGVPSFEMPNMSNLSVSCCSLICCCLIISILWNIVSIYLPF